MDSKSSKSSENDVDGDSRKRKWDWGNYWPRNASDLDCSKLAATQTGKTNSSTPQIPVGQFGFRKKFGQTCKSNFGTIHLFPSEHLSNKDTQTKFSVCDSYQIITNWYNELPPPVLNKFMKTGFQSLIDGLSNAKPDTALLLCLAEKWWDTTHTFHFEKMGEMTMTPTDFTAITGLRVGGKIIKLYKSIHTKKEELITYFGPPIGNICGRSIEIKGICEAYRGFFPENEEEEDMLLRGFIIALLGGTIFARPNNKVHLWYLPMIKDINEIEEYNWGGAGLAFMYQQMDDASRCNSTTIGGLWRAWEVWAREYIKPTKLNFTQSEAKTAFPFSIQWKDEQPPHMENGVLIQYYQIKLLDLTKKEVNWRPWVNFEVDYNQVKDSQTSNERRILLLGPYGAEWYLGERVTLQSIHAHDFFVPYPPPESMLVVQDLTIVTEEWAINGKPALEFVESKEAKSYDDFRTKCFQSLRAIEAKIENGDWSKSSEEDDNKQSINNIFPMPLWTLLLPSIVGGPNIISIPRDVAIENLEIPPHVKHISVETAKNLLSMIGGMHHVLIEQLTNARHLLRDYTIIIQRLKHRLDVTQDNNNEEQDNEPNERDNWRETDQEVEEKYANNDIGSSNKL